MPTTLSSGNLLDSHKVLELRVIKTYIYGYVGSSGQSVSGHFKNCTKVFFMGSAVWFKNDCACDTERCPRRGVCKRSVAYQSGDFGESGDFYYRGMPSCDAFICVTCDSNQKLGEAKGYVRVVE